MALYRWTDRGWERRSLRGIYAAGDCFLVCPGPSLRHLDPATLRVPGAFTLAINTAYPHVRPDVWLGMDRPECYDAHLPQEPFPKIFGSRYQWTRFLGRPLREAPNAYFASSVPDSPETDPAAAWTPDRMGDDFPISWVGVTFHAALHAAAWLGARRIWLVGADFGGPADYHDDRVLEDHLARENRRLMQVTVASLPAVRDAAARLGVEIRSATADSAANAHLAYTPLADVLADLRARAPDTAGHVRIHAHIAEHGTWADRIAPGLGVVTGTDARCEYLLPWWLANLRRHEPDLPVTFADFGMTDGGRDWCRAHGRLVDLTRTRLRGWLNKPSAILASGQAFGLWLDTDCEVRGPLLDAWVAASAGLACAVDGHNRGDEGPQPVNTGVVAFRYGDVRVERWARAILAAPDRWPGDQEVFNALVAEGRIEPAGHLPKHLNHLRLDGPPPAGAVIVHHTGPAGKASIRDAALRLVPQRRGIQLAAWLKDALGEGPIEGVEVGVLSGVTSAQLLRYRPRLVLWMVDRWAPPDADSPYAASGDDLAGRPPEDFARWRREAEANTAFAAHRRHIVVAESVEAAAQFLDASLDFVFLDADHSREGVAADLEAWWPKIRPGGLVAGHDWENPDFPGFGVEEAVLAFLAGRPDAGPVQLGADLTWCVAVPAASREPAAAEPAPVEA